MDRSKQLLIREGMGGETREKQSRAVLGQGSVSPSSLHAQLLQSCWLFATLWTVVCQAPLFMGFPRQEYWSGCHFLLQEIYLTQRSNLHLLCLLHFRRILYPLSHLGSPTVSLSCFAESETPSRWGKLWYAAHKHIDPQSRWTWRLSMFTPICCCSVAQLCVWLFATPWTTAHQASLSFTISRSLLKRMSIELMMPSNHLILGCHLLLLPSISVSSRVFSSDSYLPHNQPIGRTVHELITPFFTTKLVTILPKLGHSVLRTGAMSPFAWQSNKAILCYFTQNSVSKIWFSTSIHGSWAFSIKFIV